MKNEKKTVVFNVIQDGVVIHKFTKNYVIYTEAQTRQSYVKYGGEKNYIDFVESVPTVSISNNFFQAKNKKENVSAN